MTLSNTEGQIIRFAEISKVGLARLSPSATEEPRVKAVQACLVQDVTAGHFPGFRAWYVVEQPVSVSARAEDIIWSVPDGYRHADVGDIEVPWPREGDDIINAPADPAGVGGSDAEQVTG